jgi:hypothetical protein
MWVQRSDMEELTLAVVQRSMVSSENAQQFGLGLFTRRFIFRRTKRHGDSSTISFACYIIRVNIQKAHAVPRKLSADENRWSPLISKLFT